MNTVKTQGEKKNGAVHKESSHSSVKGLKKRRGNLQREKGVCVCTVNVYVQFLEIYCV